MQKKITQSDETVPKWNLSSIYSDIFADDYNAELCEYKKSIEAQKNLLCQDKSIVDCAQFADWLLRYVTAWEQTASLATTLNAVSSKVINLHLNRFLL